MIEITFTQSAAGSMQAAKDNGLFEGTGSDVYCFSLFLDIGNLRGDMLGQERLEVLEELFSVYPFGKETAREIIDGASSDMRRLEKCITSAEPIRIWYSSEPDEMCGYLWFASILQEMPAHGPVHLVRLPDWDTNGGSVVFHTGWGEVTPEEWTSFLPFVREAPNLLIAGRQYDWTILQDEHGTLRAVISGKVRSVPEDFYDFLIYDALTEAGDEFPEALIIGNVLGRSQIGMSDAWLAHRIDAMVTSGLLEQAGPAADPDAPAYHRNLRKTPALFELPAYPAGS